MLKNLQQYMMNLNVEKKIQQNLKIALNMEQEVEWFAAGFLIQTKKMEKCICIQYLFDKLNVPGKLNIIRDDSGKISKITSRYF